MSFQINKKPTFDRSINLTFMTVGLIAIFISAYKMVSYTDCSAAQFVIDQEELVTGKIISFKDQTPDANEWEWTFGDSSNTVTNEEALHVYKQPGEYIVRLRVNGGCTAKQKITIGTATQKKNTEGTLYPSVKMPATAHVGESVQFKGDREGAREWKWSFGESMKVDATTQNPTYVYQSSGTKTVTLIVNNEDRYAMKRKITVFAKPIEKPEEFEMKPQKKIEIPQMEPEEVAEVPMAPPLEPLQEVEAGPEISRIQLEDYLLQVAEEKRKPKTLKPFMCQGYKTPVRANGTEYILQEILQRFKGNKIGIKNLEISKNKTTRCINFIKVDYKKDKILGIF